MKRRDFLKATIAAPLVGVALPSKGDAVKVKNGVLMAAEVTEKEKTSTRILDAINNTKAPCSICVASDVFADLADEFTSRINVYMSGNKTRPRPMYFAGIPVREESTLPKGMIVIYSSNTFTDLDFYFITLFHKKEEISMVKKWQ